MKCIHHSFLSVLCVCVLSASTPAISNAQNAESQRTMALADKTLYGQPSYLLSSGQVELAVTLVGGHMAPVRFYRDTPEPIEPYHISPWQEEKGPEMPAAVLVPLRGDFFCMPFGGNADAVDSEKHPPHGEVASAPWIRTASERTGDVSRLTLTMKTTARLGTITKDLFLIDSQNVVYSKHTIEGFTGKVPLGHHATLSMPDREGAVRLSSSPIQFGMTYPGLFSDPKQGEYQALKPGQRWESLNSVPVAWKGKPDADLSRLPTHQGFADLVQIYNVMPDKYPHPAWMTATFTDKGYVWFSLKNPELLNSTVFWIENRGRHGYPWLGRNHCLGLEDVTAYFADGLKDSIEPNMLNQQGIRTAIELKKDSSTVIPYIQGVVRIPKGFEVVKSIEFAEGEITLVSDQGQRVRTPVRHEFLKTGKL